MITSDETALAFASYVPISLMCDKKFVQFFLKQTKRLIDTNFIKKFKVAFVWNLKYMNLSPVMSLEMYNNLIEDYNWTQSA